MTTVFPMGCQHLCIGSHGCHCSTFRMLAASRLLSLLT